MYVAREVKQSPAFFVVANFIHMEYDHIMICELQHEINRKTVNRADVLERQRWPSPQDGDDVLHHRSSVSDSL